LIYSLEDEALMQPKPDYVLNVTPGPSESYTFPANIISVQIITSPIKGIVSSHTDRTMRFTPSLKPTSPQDLETVDKITRLLGTRDAVVLSMDVHPKYPHLLLTSNMSGTVTLYDLAESKVLASWKQHTKYAVAARFVSSRPSLGDWIVSAGHDGLVNIYRQSTATTTDTTQADITVTVVADTEATNVSDAPIYTLYKQHRFRTAVEAVCALPPTSSAGPEIVVAIRDDPYLRYLRLDTDEEQRFSINADPLDTHVSFSILDLSVSPCGQYIAAATDKEPVGLVIVYACKQERQVASWFVASVPPFSRARCAWLGQRVLAALGDENVYVLQVGSDTPHFSWPAHKTTTRCLLVDTKNQQLITGGFDARLCVWSYTAREATHTR
jgi:WD40 repeat protein